MFLPRDASLYVSVRPFLCWRLVDLSPSGPCFVLCPVTNCNCMYWWH